MSLGETIYRLRTEKNLSQGDLAEILEVSRQSVSKWENNSATPDLEKMIKLSECFGVSLDELAKGEEKPSAVTMMENVIPEISKKVETAAPRKTAGTIIMFLSILVFVLAIMLLVNIFVSNKGKSSGKTLYEQGLEVVSLMVEATRSEKYVEIYTGSAEIKEIVQGIGAGDYTTPKAVYTMTASDEVLLGLSELVDLEGESVELKSTLTKKAFGTLITQLNGMSGVEKLAAASVCTMVKTFVDENLTENVIYIYMYEDALPVAVTFIMGEDGSVSANGTFIMYDEFAHGSAEDIRAFFGEYSIVVNELE